MYEFVFEITQGKFLFHMFVVIFRCSNAIIGHSILQNQSESNSSDMNTIFLKCVLGRIYLRKARISEKNNEVSDTFHYYKRAAMYAPGDV